MFLTWVAARVKAAHLLVAVACGLVGAGAVCAEHTSDEHTSDEHTSDEHTSDEHTWADQPVGKRSGAAQLGAAHTGAAISGVTHSGSPHSGASQFGAGGLAQADVVITVGPAGQYQSVQAAIDAVPAEAAGEAALRRHVIEIAPGTYTEQININKPRVSLIGMGDDATKTVLRFHEAAQPGNRLANASAAVTASDFFASNLTFANTFGKGKVALAMYVRADRAVFSSVRFVGWQDTLRAEKGRSYFEDCHVEGAVDYVYGQGKAWFERCTFYSVAGGYVTAQGKEGAKDDNGFVFHRVIVTGSAPDQSVYLGRPWQAYSTAIFLNSRLDKVINPAGWSAWSGNDHHTTCHFAEFGNSGPGSAGKRVAWAKRLSQPEAEQYTVEAWLAGTDQWNPLAVIGRHTRVTQGDAEAARDGDEPKDGNKQKASPRRDDAG